jgi:hypothetical protein
MQGEHAVAPWITAYDPGGHARHAVEPARGALVPGAHCKHGLLSTLQSGLRSDLRLLLDLPDFAYMRVMSTAGCHLHLAA